MNIFSIVQAITHCGLNCYSYCHQQFYWIHPRNRNRQQYKIAYLPSKKNLSPLISAALQAPMSFELPFMTVEILWQDCSKFDISFLPQISVKMISRISQGKCKRLGDGGGAFGTIEIGVGANLAILNVDLADNFLKAWKSLIFWSFHLNIDISVSLSEGDITKRFKD